MKKFKLFMENFLVYGFGGIISKIVPLIMVPIVTRLMPDSTYYGLSDLSSTVMNFCQSFAVMGMYDAMYRLFFEREENEYKKRVCSTAFSFTLITSLTVFLFMVIFRKWIAGFFFGDIQYANLVYLTAMATLVGATNSIVCAPTRMQNKRKVFLVANTLSPVLSYSISIPLLLAGYYLIALPLAAIISAITLEISFGIMNHEWFKFKYFDKKILKQLLIIGIPLLPNFIIYWIFNSSDKVMITNMLGVAAAGIYSVGSKLGQVSQLIRTAFSGGWQFFAFSTMNDENQVKTNSLIFEYLGVVSFVVTLFMCTFSELIFTILFTEEYYSAYIVAPYLFLAPLLQMLYQVAGNQFVIIKKTWPTMLVLSIGVVLNIFLNLCLIPMMGIEGAAIATLVGYIASDLIGIFVLNKMKLMEISGRFLIFTLSFAAAFIIWRLFTLPYIWLNILLISWISILGGFLYYKELKIIYMSLIKFVRRD